MLVPELTVKVLPEIDPVVETTTPVTPAIVTEEPTENSVLMVAKVAVAVLVPAGGPVPDRPVKGINCAGLIPVPVICVPAP
jgi:hypothetical protein